MSRVGQPSKKAKFDVATATSGAIVTFYDSEDDSEDDSEHGTKTAHKNPDRYESVSKVAQRAEFAINCASVPPDRSLNRDILYLETASGKITNELLGRGFDQADLHPCNRSRAELDALLATYPQVHVEHGNILNIFKRQQWLGVWFDLETSLLVLDDPKQPWDFERVPEFSRAAVCAISLSSRRVHGTAEQFAIELQSLMQRSDGFVTSPQMSRAYSGRSGKQNMIFALGHYKVPLWEPADYLYQRVHIPLDYYGNFNRREDYMIVDGHLVAVVSRVGTSGMLHFKFQSRAGWFFRDEDPEAPVSRATVQRWMDLWAARVSSAR
jgi:hypothetical protein